MDKKKDKKSAKTPDITFFHPELFEVPTDGPAPFLKGYRCKNCNQLDFPKLQMCPSCWGKEFEMVPLSRKGVVYSATDNYVGQQGMKPPYVFGYIDLPEGLRIFAQFEAEVGTIECGDDVEVVEGIIRMNRDGVPVKSYKFKKIES